MRRAKLCDVTTTAQSAPWADDDPIPENIDDFRNELARRIYRFVGNRARAWRDCPEACCRRARHCLAPRGDCTHRPPGPKPTPEQFARFMAQLQRALRERLEQDGGRSEEAGK